MKSDATKTMHIGIGSWLINTPAHGEFLRRPLFRPEPEVQPIILSKQPDEKFEPAPAIYKTEGYELAKKHDIQLNYGLSDAIKPELDPLLRLEHFLIFLNRKGIPDAGGI